MGTALLSILCGHWRYAHINSVRGDTINAGLLGMGRIVSEDVVRTGLKRMEENRSLEWVRGHLLQSASAAIRPSSSPPSRIKANLIALFYNWWNFYIRFYDEAHHREAICACFLEKSKEALSPLRSGSSPPALMQGVASQVQGGGQRRVKVSLLHGNKEVINQLVQQTSRQLQRIKLNTERWSAQEKRSLLLTRRFRRWVPLARRKMAARAA
jgi:hypothetical protein